MPLKTAGELRFAGHIDSVPVFLLPQQVHRPEQLLHALVLDEAQVVRMLGHRLRKGSRLGQFLQLLGELAP